MRAERQIAAQVSQRAADDGERGEVGDVGALDVAHEVAVATDGRVVLGEPGVDADLGRAGGVGRRSSTASVSACCDS